MVFLLLVLRRPHLQFSADGHLAEVGLYDSWHLALRFDCSL